jgi:4'-phosphopantetheinyl transferase
MEMRPHEIEVWNIALDAPPAGAETLSTEERERAARFFAERDRNRYLVAHIALRDLLGRATSTPPHTLDFRVNNYGKPALANEPGIEFNLSHSQDHALLAIARGVRLGADIEWQRQDFDVVKLAQRFFAPPEVERVRAEPHRFFEIWTRKEAFIKAIGMGVSFPLQEFDTCSEQVEFSPAAQELAGGDWFVQNIGPPAGYLAAIAVNVPSIHIAVQEWTPSPSR